MGRGSGRYVVVGSRGGVVGVYDSFIDAFKALLVAGGGLLVRGEVLVRLGEEEASELLALLSDVMEAPEAPVSRSRVAVVLDQMYKGFFAGVLARELPGDVEIHEIAGRGVERPVRAGNIVREPARDDYDVITLLERLAGRGLRVIFFTGDKRLAAQAETVRGVKVYYAPPSEYPGKESLAKYMVEKIREELGRL